MAIGGYKFRGYHYPARTATAGSDAEKAIFLDWFKCRLAAFKASCEASGALWRLLPACANTGATSSDDWGDGQVACIHELDDTGCNFGTFFQYGDEDKYMAIVSLNDPYTGWNTKKNGCWSMYSSQDLYYYYGYDSIALDKNPITPENIFSAVNGRLLMCGVTGHRTYQVPSARNVNDVTNGPHFGFTTKDDDICEFYTAASGTQFTHNTIYFHVCSLNAFSSLCAPNDTYYAAGFVSPMYYYQSSSLVTESSLYTKPVQFIKDDGVSFSGKRNTTDYQTSFINCDFLSGYTSTNSVIPFSSPTVASMNPNVKYSESGLSGKGSLRCDLAAQNHDIGQMQNLSTLPGAAYGGGNYLCVGIIYGSTLNSYQRAFYIGWDPSNPSILASTSWPDWPDAMPAAPQPQTVPEPDPVIVQ